MTQLHFYADQSKAKRAALSKLGKNAQVGKDFHFIFSPDRKVAYEPVVKKPSIATLPSFKVVDGKKVEVAKVSTIVEKTPRKLSAKNYIRNLFIVESGQSFTMEEMVSGGYTEINLKTALADLKNPLYCGAEGELHITSHVRNGIRYYHQFK